MENSVDEPVDDSSEVKERALPNISALASLIVVIFAAMIRKS